MRIYQTLLRYGDHQFTTHLRGKVRMPFYDQRIAKFGFFLPSDHHTSSPKTKCLLRDPKEAILPHVIWKRRNKHRFLPPEGSGFVDGLVDLARENLGDDAFWKCGYIDLGWCQGVLKRRAASETHLVWLLRKRKVSETWHQICIAIVNGRNRQLVIQESAK